MTTKRQTPMRHIFLLLLITALLLGQVQITSAATTAATSVETPTLNIESAVLEIQVKIAAHWPHMDKVWPTYDYSNHNLILFYVNDADSSVRVWRLGVDGTRELEASEYELIAMPQPGGYEQLDFEDKPSIAMSVEDNLLAEEDVVDTLYRVATHELVHFYYQSEQAPDESGGSRAQAFPVDKTPRLYRRMIYENLIRAYDNPNDKDQYLGKARYWLDRWQNEYQEEATAIHATDMAEAPAKYTDNLATFITREMTADDIYKEAGKHIDRDSIFYSADAESYEIGNVAALLLDKQSTGWKDSYYRDKQTIEEKLLADVQPIEDTIDPDIENKLTTALDQYNEQTKDEIADIIETEATKDIPYLKLDISASTSSMSAAAMLSYEDKEIIVRYANQFSVDGKTVELDGVNVIDSYNDDGRSYLYIPLPNDATFADDQLTVESDKLKIDGIKATLGDEDGRKVYQAIVDGGTDGIQLEDTPLIDD